MTFAELTVKFNSVGASSVKKDVSDLSGMMGSFAGKLGMATTAGGLAADAIVALGKAIFDLGKASVNAAVDFDTNVRALANFSKNSQELSAQLDRLREIAKMPGLGLPEVMAGVVKLEAAGLSANLAEKAIKQFGNALTLAGKGKADLDGIALALSQIQAKGVVSAEEINQIAERAPQIRQAMVAAFGTADTKAIQEMGISSEQFITKIIEQLQKLPRAQGGLLTMFENIKDEANTLMVTLGQGFMSLFGGGGGAATSIMEFAKTIAEQTNTILKGLSESPTFKQISANIKVIFDNLKQFAPFFKAIFIGVVSLIAGIVKQITQQIAYIMNFLGQLIKDPIGVMRNEFKVLGEQIKAIFINVSVGVLEIIKKMLGYIDKVAGTNLASKIQPGKTVTVPGATAGQKALGAMFSLTRGKFMFPALIDAAKMAGEAYGYEGPLNLLSAIKNTGGPTTKIPTTTIDKDKDEKHKKETHKKADKHQKTLEQIRDHTKSAELTLREFTYGGGVLGGAAVSKADLAMRGKIYAPSTTGLSDLERGVLKITRSYTNNNNLNLNFGRS